MAPPKQTESTDIEVNGFTLPGNVRLQMGESSMLVGNSYSNGMTVSGIIERITYIGNGVMRVAIGDRRLLVFSTGMVAEEKKP